MAPETLRFCFDYLDPLSFLVQGELDALAQEGGLPPVRRLPVELRPPPLPLLDPDGEEWMALWGRGVEFAAGLGVTLEAPPLLPWTRKAHELVLHACEKGAGDAVHRLVLDAVFVHGRDVGRVDVLVEIARRGGLDAHEAKAVLDVDRHAAAVEALRAEAEAAGAPAPPTLLLGERTLQGFHNRDSLRTFLLR